MSPAKITACFFALLTLCGCIPKYISKSENQARISIKYFWGYESDELISILKLEDVKSNSCIRLSGISILATVNKGNPLAPKTSNQKNILIDAGKPVKLRISMTPAASIGTMRFYQNCQREITFTPKSNSEYELSLKSPPCDVALLENGAKVNADVKPFPCL
jgi:hypothetical protein